MDVFITYKIQFVYKTQNLNSIKNGNVDSNITALKSINQTNKQNTAEGPPKQRIFSYEKPFL